MEPEAVQWVNDRIARLYDMIGKLEVRITELESENERLRVILETRR